MKWYVRAEDLVVAWVGPFNSWIEASNHIDFCTARGDGALIRDEGQFTPGGDMVMTPEEDRAFVPPKED